MAPQVNKALETLFREGNRWWENLSGEVKQARPEANYLETQLDAWLGGDGWRHGVHREQHFFSKSGKSSMDRRFENVGIEEKVIPLEWGKLLDGAVCRGLVWVFGGRPEQL